MRKFLSAAAMTAALLGGAAIATPAAAIDFVGTFTVSQYQSGESNGLEIELSRETGALNFDLDAIGPGGGNYAYVKLFDIWAGEDIDSNNNHDDWRDFEIDFNFTQPDFDGGVEGSTRGVFRSGNSDTAELLWDDDNTWSFAFGNGGILKVFLTDAEFRQSNDKDDVYAKFWVEKMPTPVSAVPEPSAWALMIGGFGLAGAALRRQRRTAMTAA
jgi:hypothetical protein